MKKLTPVIFAIFTLLIAINVEVKGNVLRDNTEEKLLLEILNSAATEAEIFDFVEKNMQIVIYDASGNIISNIEDGSLSELPLNSYYITTAGNTMIYLAE